MTGYFPRRTVLRTIGLGGLALAGGVTAASAKPLSADSLPEVLYEFAPPNPDEGFPGELPENVAVDRRGTKFVSVPSLGQIWTFSPENELVGAPFTQFETSGAFLVGVTGLEADPNGSVFACFASDLDTVGGSATNGVWTVDRDGEPTLLAELPPDDYDGLTFPNDLTLFGDSVLVTDSFRGVVYRVGADGTAEVWVDSGLLDPDGGFGANGIAVGKDGTVYVANLDQGRIVEIPVGKDGSAGEPDTFVQSEELIGADGLAFDTRGSLYVAVNAQNAIRRVSPDGEIETLAENGLDGVEEFDFPADVTFGTSRVEQKSVFIPNLAFSADPYPTLMKLDVGVPGLPIHR
jgi:hypothetical protein